MSTRAEMEAATEAALDELAHLDDEEALTAAYSIAAFLIFARYAPHQWGERLTYVRNRLPVVFQGLIDEFNRRNGHASSMRTPQ